MAGGRILQLRREKGPCSSTAEKATTVILRTLGVVCARRVWAWKIKSFSLSRSSSHSMDEKKPHTSLDLNAQKGRKCCGASSLPPSHWRVSGFRGKGTPTPTTPTYCTLCLAPPIRLSWPIRHGRLARLPPFLSQKRTSPSGGTFAEVSEWRHRRPSERCQLSPLGLWAPKAMEWRERIYPRRPFWGGWHVFCVLATTVRREDAAFKSMWSKDAHSFLIWVGQERPFWEEDHAIQQQKHTRSGTHSHTHTATSHHHEGERNERSSVARRGANVQYSRREEMAKPSYATKTYWTALSSSSSPPHETEDEALLFIRRENDAGRRERKRILSNL